MDEIEIQSKDVWAGNASGITFSLLQKSVNTTQSMSVGIRLIRISTETVGTQRGIAIDGNLNIGVGASQITRQKTSDEYIELDLETLNSLIDFINWSFREKTPSRKMTLP